MSESHQNPEIQAITDAVGLAFWGVDFEECTSELLECAPKGEEGNMFDGRIREKSGYDVERGFEFTATNIRCTMYHDGNLIDADMVVVFWEDGMNAAVDTKDLFTEQRVRLLGEYDEDELEHAMQQMQLRMLIKSALLQLADLSN